MTLPQRQPSTAQHKQKGTLTLKASITLTLANAHPYIGLYRNLS